MLLKLLLGAQQVRPKSLKAPPVGVVDTHTAYLVRVRMPQAVTWAQLDLVNGYSTVPVPMVTYTGALMVVAAGIA